MSRQSNGSLLEDAIYAADTLRNMLPNDLKKPKTGIICGSGLGGLVSKVECSPKIEIGYVDIPHFCQSTVEGHAGKLLFGQLGALRAPVVIMVGRLHYYEGHSIHEVTFPIRVLSLLGISTLIVTNAAGGLNPSYCVGDIVVLSDHINLAGLSGIHPLRGPNVEKFGARFPALSDAYDLDLRRKVHATWKTLQSEKRRLQEGVYAFVSGPSYETRAECRLLHQLGADLVGMSTVPEVIVARHCGIRVLALSLVTNNAVLDAGPSGDDDAIQNFSSEDLRKINEKGKADHQEVLEAGELAAEDIERLICQLMDNLF